MPPLTSSLHWDDFRLVKAIADSGSLTAAAERLELNHSTVFRRLGDIEQRVSTALFERHRSGYTPTPAGEEMVQLASKMDEDITRFGLKLAGQDMAPSGELRITTNDTLIAHLLMPVFAKFRSAYPQIRLELIVGNQVLNLSKRDADIAIRPTDQPPETLVGRRMADLAWAIYGRKGDALSARAITKAELESQTDLPWIGLGEQFNVFKACRYVNQQIGPDKIAMRINTVLGLSEAVAAGIGIGPLPCFIADQHPDLVRLHPVMPEFSTGLWLLTHADLKTSPRVRAFMDFGASEIARLRPLLEGRTASADIDNNAAAHAAVKDRPSGLKHIRKRNMADH